MRWLRICPLHGKRPHLRRQSRPPPAPFPWARVIAAVVVFVGSVSLFGPIGVAIGVGGALGMFARMTAPAAYGFLAGLTGNKWLLGAALLSGKRRR